MDGLGSEDNTLCFNDSDFYLNMDDVDIGPQIGQGAFSKVYLGRYLGELVSYFSQASTNVPEDQRVPYCFFERTPTLIPTPSLPVAPSSMMVPCVGRAVSLSRNDSLLSPVGVARVVGLSAR